MKFLLISEQKKQNTSHTLLCIFRFLSETKSMWNSEKLASPATQQKTESYPGTLAVKKLDGVR